MGPLLFALGLQQALVELVSEFPDVHVLAYMMPCPKPDELECGAQDMMACLEPDERCNEGFAVNADTENGQLCTERGEQDMMPCSEPGKPCKAGFASEQGRLKIKQARS